MDYFSEVLNSKEFKSLPESAQHLALIFIGIELSQAILKYWCEHTEEMKNYLLRLK